MPPRRSKKRHQRGRPKARRTSEPSSRLVMYRGPVRSFGAANEADLHTLVLTQEFLLTSSAGGVLATVVSDNPNAAANWSNLVNVFDEYRVLAIEFLYVPNNRYSKTVTVTTPLLIVVDHDNNAALSSYSGAAQYASCKSFALDDPFKFRAQMSEVSEASFINTTAPTSRYYIKCYSTGLTVSTSYGVVILTFRVQFRGTGV